MNRRHFLTALTALRGLSYPQRLKAVKCAIPGGYLAEAQRLTDLLHATFWRPTAKQYRAPVCSAESVDSDPPHNNGYVLWPCVEAFHALVEGEAARPGRYCQVIRDVYEGLEQYRDVQQYAYNAWLMFPGNNDKYYDDNAMLAGVLVKTYACTGEREYLNRANELMQNFVRGGWDESAVPGGMRWSTNPHNPQAEDRNACSTGMAALAALLLARYGIERQTNIKWAAAMLEWVKANLQDTDGLIMDALVPPDWTVRRVKWTYNTGHIMRGWVELHRLTGSSSALAEAYRLAKAAVDRNGAMYDGLVRNPQCKYFYDFAFFVAYLLDGLMALYHLTGDQVLLNEARRNANYAYQYLRDPSDGLYFRNWRLWRISEEHCRTWETLTGQTHPLEADENERSQEHRYDHTPVEQRPLVKTLLANAGTARMMWMVGGGG
ncbi:MAG: glycoside hydrolase family 76 protein [Candidatus Zipacnadales bacterium]